MKEKIVIAQIGCGYWGPNLLRNFSSLKNSVVKYVVEASPERRLFVEEHYPRTEAVAEVQTVWNDATVEAVIIATPAATHYSLARQALEQGKHVFVEKPLAMSVTEADELARLAAARRLTLMVGHTFLYNPAVRYAKGLVDRGELGEIHYIYSQRLNLGRVRSDVNAWWNLAPHDVSILLYLMGDEPPATVSAKGMDYIQKGIEDVVFASLIWPNRIMAHIHVSWLDPGKVRKMILVGSQKMVVYDDVSDDKIAIVDKGIDRIPKARENMDYDDFNNYQLFHRAGNVLLPKIDFKEPIWIEASHFIECVQTGQVPLTGPEHAKKVIAVLEAGQAALKSGQTIKVDLT